MANQFKESRQKCHLARDKFWECLESNNEEMGKCTKFRKDFEKCCTSQWVKYFDRQRKYNKFKAEADRLNWSELDSKEKE